MNKLGKFLKNVFVRKLWIKLAAVFLAIFVVLLLNISYLAAAAVTLRARRFIQYSGMEIY